MRKNEFLEMMWQDIETESEDKKALYADVIDCMDIALSQTADAFDIPSDKTVKGAFDAIEKAARAKKNGNVACVGPFEAASVIAEYLGTKYERASSRLSAKPQAKVNLDDYI